MLKEKEEFNKEAQQLFDQALEQPHRIWLLKLAEINDASDKAQREAEIEELNISHEIEVKHGVPEAWERARNISDPKVRDEAVIRQKQADLEKESKGGPFTLEVGTSRYGSLAYFDKRGKIRVDQKTGTEQAYQEYLKIHMPAQNALLECRRKVDWAYSGCLQTKEAQEKIASEAIEEMKRTLKSLKRGV